MIPHKIKIKIVQALIEPEILKQKTAWGRELKLLKQLGDAKYDDPVFWLTFKPGYLVHSFAFFKTDRGLMEIEQAWRQYKMDKMVQKTLDTNIKSDTIKQISDDKIPALPPQQTVMAWADSI